MTDKEIIIDGVNVAGCEYHSSTSSSELCYMKGNKCNDNSNCYYKQLQRKEQECNRYKRALEDIKSMLEVIIETNKIEPIQGSLIKILKKCEVLNEY